MIQKARPALTAVALALAIGSLAAQQPQPQPPQGRGQGRGGGGMRGAQPINFEDRSGTEPQFVFRGADVIFRKKRHQW